MNFNDFELKTFTGYLSKEPDLRYFQSGNCVTNFSIPLSKSKEDTTIWLNCKTFGDRGEKITENYKKGDRITVVGEFKTEIYKEKEYIYFYVYAVI